MSKLLEQAYDPGQFREMAHDLVDQLADHLLACRQDEALPVMNWRTPDDNLKNWKNPTACDLNHFWQNIIDDSIHIHSPKYMGHQVSSPIPMAGMGDLMNGILNNGSAVYEMGPVSTVMERAVIKWLGASIGYPAGSEGFVTSGGSIGNLTALLAARQQMVPGNAWMDGLPAGYQPAIIVSGEAHYSIARAVQILGWGAKAVVKAPVDDHLRLDSTALPELKRQIEKSGMTLVAVIANSCSTSTGAYDPLEEIANFCEENSIWMHVDGAHGGSAALSPTYRHLTAGINRADSVVVDFHKMMGISSLTTAILFKEKNPSYQSFSQDASYILDESKPHEWFNSAKRTLECTKNMMAVKVYAILAHYGEQVFIDYLDACYGHGKLFADIIKKHPDFELAVEPESNIVCFRYLQPTFHPQTVNDINASIRQKVLENGKFYIVQTEIDGSIYLRVTLMNPFTSINEMKQLLDHILDLIPTDHA